MKSGKSALSRYWWLAFLVALSSIFLAASECEQTSDNTQGQGQPLPSVGQVFHATKDGWDITVTSVSREPGTAGADQLLVGVHVTNTGLSAHALGPNRFELHDATGRTWKDLAYEAAGGMIELSLQDVQPGLSTDLGLSFLIPTGAQGLWLETIGGGHIVLE